MAKEKAIPCVRTPCVKKAVFRLQRLASTTAGEIEILKAMRDRDALVAMREPADLAN